MCPSRPGLCIKWCQWPLLVSVDSLTAGTAAKAVKGGGRGGERWVTVPWREPAHRPIPLPARAVQAAHGGAAADPADQRHLQSRAHAGLPVCRQSQFPRAFQEWRGWLGRGSRFKRFHRTATADDGPVRAGQPEPDLGVWRQHELRIGPALCIHRQCWIKQWDRGALRGGFAIQYEQPWGLHDRL